MTALGELAVFAAGGLSNRAHDWWRRIRVCLSLTNPLFSYPLISNSADRTVDERFQQDFTS